MMHIGMGVKAYFVAVLLLLGTSSSHAGYRARVSVKVYEGSQVSVNERNLIEEVSCGLAFLDSGEDGTQPISVGRCLGRLRVLGEREDAGRVEISLSTREGDSAKLLLSILADGYVGGGQDGPYFTTSVNLSANQSHMIRFNLGYYSKTPERAQDFLLLLTVGDLAECIGVSACDRGDP